MPFFVSFLFLFFLKILKCIAHFSVFGEEFLKFFFQELSNHFFLISGQLPQNTSAVIGWLEVSLSFLTAVIMEVIRACQ